jgi:predicted nucleic acid-binding protein
MSDLYLSMTSVVVDTDVAARFHRKRLPADVHAKLIGMHKMLPFVTVGELIAWTERRYWNPRKTEELQRWLDDSSIVFADDSVAAIWGRITAAARKTGRTPQVNDAWIAACCLAYDLPLMTMNARDYQYFAEHHGLVLL